MLPLPSDYFQKKNRQWKLKQSVCGFSNGKPG